MKSHDIQTLRQKPEVELQKMLTELRDALWKQQLELERGKVKNIREVRDTRKGIARVMTLLRGLQS